MSRVLSVKAPAGRRQFGSDNYAGICPEAWAALAKANQGHARGYGDDEWTLRAADLIREVFETHCEVFLVFSGTAANSLALASICHSYHCIICHENAHAENDECGGPEFFSNGAKVLAIRGENGKLDPASIEQAALKRTDVHYPRARAVTITQATELGTVYSPAELKAIGGVCKKVGLRWHMDGARFANAVASLGCAPREITWEAGIDVLSLGATKNGTAVGEAVVFFDRDLAHEFDYRCKQAGQLASKMRFLAAPWVGMLQDGAWLRHARHANAMAEYLETALRQFPQVRIMYPRQANAVFVELPVDVIQGLWDRGWMFYNFIGPRGCRLMCAWDTIEQDVDAFVDDLKQLLARH